LSDLCRRDPSGRVSSSVAQPHERWRLLPTKNPHETLVLHPCDSTLRGRVVDGAGRPLVGRSVRVLEPLVGWLDGPVAFGVRLIEENAFFQGVVTDGDGRFELQGLSPRDHRLLVLDPETFERFESPAFPIGKEALVVVPVAGDLEPEWNGRVVDVRGAGIAGAEITVVLSLPLADAGSAPVHQRRFVADGEGFVRLPPQSANGLQVVFDAPGRVTESRARSELRRSEVRLGRLAEFRFCPAEPLSTEQRSLEVLDDQGRVLPVNGPWGSMIVSMRPFYFEGGRTAVLATSECATTLVVYESEGSRRRELRRCQLQLIPGEITLVE
jgi:hypothetical protein